MPPKMLLLMNKWKNNLNSLILQPNNLLAHHRHKLFQARKEGVSDSFDVFYATTITTQIKIDIWMKLNLFSFFCNKKGKYKFNKSSTNLLLLPGKKSICRIKQFGELKLVFENYFPCRTWRCNIFTAKKYCHLKSKCKISLLWKFQKYMLI